MRFGVPIYLASVRLPSRRLSVAVIAAIMLGACAQPGGAPPENLASGSGRLRTAAGNLARIEYRDQRATLRFLDKDTLKARSGSVPIDLDFLETYVVSADRRRLATVSSDSSSAPSVTRTFRVIDLDAGVTMLTTHNHRSPRGGVFSADGKSVYWVVAEGVSVFSGFRLSLDRQDLGTGEFVSSLPLPHTFAERDYRALPDGAIAIFGTINEFDPGGILTRSTGALIRVTAHGQTTTLELPQVRFLRSSPASGGRPADREAFEPGLAWDLERRLLHVVHADEARVTTARLTDLTVVSHRQISPKGSIASGLLSWLMPSAIAKEPITSTSRIVQMDPNGETIYLTGVRQEVERASEGEVNARFSALDLKVVRTTDYAEMAELGGGISSLNLSPDGHHLVVSQDALIAEPNPDSKFPSLHMRLLRASDLTVVTEFADNDLFNGFSVDGRTAYVSRCRNSDFEGPGSLRAVDVATGEVRAQVPAMVCQGNLVGLAQ